jgi:hypothetical protein
MPARMRDDGNARFNSRLIKIAREVHAIRSGRYLKAAAGQAGAERSSVAMQALISDGILVNYAVIIFPAQEPGPAMALRIANATDDFEWCRKPDIFLPLLFPASPLDSYEEALFRVHREWWKGYKCRAPSIGIRGISEANDISQCFANKIVCHSFSPSFSMR